MSVFLKVLSNYIRLNHTTRHIYNLHNAFSKIKGHISVLVIPDRLLGSVQWGHHQYLTVGPKSRHDIPTCRDTKTNAVLFFCMFHFSKIIFTFSILFVPTPPNRPKLLKNRYKILGNHNPSEIEEIEKHRI